MQMQVNLLPSHLRPKPQVRLLPVLIASVLLLSVIGMGTYWLILSLDLAGTRTEIKDQELNIAAIERGIEDNLWKQTLKDNVATKEDFLKEQTMESVLWYPALDLIEQALLPGVQVETIVFMGSGRISIDALVDKIKTGADFWASLQAQFNMEDIWVYTISEAKSINLTLNDWSGREVVEDVD